MSSVPGLLGYAAAVSRLNPTLVPANRDKMIDGYRGVAVLGVLAAHSAAYRFNTPAFIARVFEPAGEVGVQLFFVISGFIITTLLLREERKEGRISIRAFYARRCFRILPPLFCYYAALFVARAGGAIEFDPATIASSAGFTCNTGLTGCDWWVAHTWSLAVEEQYYLVWPLLLTVLPPRWRVPFLVTTIAALLAGFLASPLHWHSNWISFACIASGALYGASPELQAAIRRQALRLWPVALALFVAGHVLPMDRAIMVMTPALLPVLIFGSREFPLVLRLLESPPLQLIGLGSYSLYLWQELFLGAPDQYSQPLPLTALPIIVALSYFLIEQPCARLGHKISAEVKLKSGERRSGSETKQPAEAPPL